MVNVTHNYYQRCMYVYLLTYSHMSIGVLVSVVLASVFPFFFSYFSSRLPFPLTAHTPSRYFLFLLSLSTPCFLSSIYFRQVASDYRHRSPSARLFWDVYGRARNSPTYYVIGSSHLAENLQSSIRAPTGKWIWRESGEQEKARFFLCAFSTYVLTLFFCNHWQSSDR